MAGGNAGLETNEDVSKLSDELLTDPSTAAIIMTAALIDYEGEIGITASGKYATRLSTRDSPTSTLYLSATEKIINKIKRKRPDIILVGFKTTSGDTEIQQRKKALRLIKNSACDMVLVNDLSSRTNMLVGTPGTLVYPTLDRSSVLNDLATLVAGMIINSEDVDDINSEPAEDHRWQSAEDYSLPVKQPK